MYTKKVDKYDIIRIKKKTSRRNKKRISDLDRLFSCIYEDNVIGKLSDERYSRMASEYETEQKELITKVAESENQLAQLQNRQWI